MKTKKIENTFAKTTAELWDDFYGPESGKEAEFYLKQFGADRPLSGKTLDIGCGTGRFMVPLMKRGHECIGLDGSPEMLDVLRRKASAAGLAAELKEMQFADYQYSGTFGGITAFYVIFYILDAEELRAFFKKAFDLLSSGGVLLFNYYNLFEFWQPKEWSYTNTYTFEGGFGRLEYTYKPVDHLRGIADMQDYSMISKNEETAFDYNVRPVRFYSMTELMLLLEDIGFTGIKTHADLKDEPVSAGDSKGLTLYTIARKP